MKIESALMGISQIYLDTAPVIYYVQGVTPFFPVVDALFQEIERGSLGAIASPVTLTECLVLPIRISDAKLEEQFGESARLEVAIRENLRKLKL